MAGIGRRMPVTMLAFSITAIGMIGLPPVAGFISKLYLCFGAWDLGSPYGIIFLSVILISSLLDVVYFFPIIHSAFFGNPEAASEEKRSEAPLLVLLPLTITAIFSVVFFFFPNTFYILDLVKTAAGNLFGGV
jgi:formate hydrogenlyase subunit 3/multisubunit Na+/H+ antiporter MnhD subunit